jgi:hypothetical protein
MATIKKRELVLALYTGDPDAGLEAALVRAGYSKARAAITACEFRRDPQFIAALERKQAKLADKAERGELTETEVINGIRDIDEECKPAGPIAAYLTIRLKAHEVLCKIRGMFIEKIEFGFGSELELGYSSTLLSRGARGPTRYSGFAVPLPSARQPPLRRPT